MSKIPKSHTFQEKEGKYGIWTTNDSKKMCAAYFEDYLNAPDQLVYSKDFVCANPFVRSDLRAGKVKEMLFQQLGKFRKRWVEPENGKGPATLIISGKVDNEGKLVQGQNDDLVMALIILSYWATKWKRGKLNVNYGQFK